MTADAARWRVIVRGLVVETEIGLLPEEHGRTQPLRVDLEVELDTSEIATLDDSVDYGAAAADVRALAADGPWRMVEDFASRVALRVLARPRAAAVTVRVLKTTLAPDAEGVGCELRLARSGAREG